MAVVVVVVVVVVAARGGIETWEQVRDPCKVMREPFCGSSIRRNFAM
jgi:hypothetical protein